MKLWRQEVSYFQPCSGERSMHWGWDWHDTCAEQLWPFTNSRIKCLIIGRAAAESAEEQGRLGLTVLTLFLCVCVNLKEKLRRGPLGRLENCDVNGEDGNGRYCLLRTRACFEVGKTKYPKCRNHGSRRRNAYHSIRRCPLGLPAARGLWAEKTPSSVKGRTSRCELRG